MLRKRLSVKRGAKVGVYFFFFRVRVHNNPNLTLTKTLKQSFFLKKKRPPKCMKQEFQPKLRSTPEQGLEQFIVLQKLKSV